MRVVEGRCSYYHHWQNTIQIYRSWPRPTRPDLHHSPAQRDELRGLAVQRVFKLPLVLVIRLQLFLCRRGGGEMTSKYL